MSGIVDRWRKWARILHNEVRALVFAFRDPRTPWYARVVAVCVAGYALSPIDLIPDVIPVVGYLDDLIILPIGIWLAIRMIPSGVMEEARERARSGENLTSGSHRIATAVIVALWLLAIALCLWLVSRWL